MEVRVRFAPSPTGALHIGGVRTALYNYLFARKMGGKMLLRIEDTDQKRLIPNAEQYIIDALAWVGIGIDEGQGAGGPHAPYRQSERKEIYQAHVQQLLDEGKAYHAFDTDVEIEAMRQRLTAANVANPSYNALTRTQMRNSLTLPEAETKALLAAGTSHVIRVKVPLKEEIRFHDLIRDWVVVHANTLDDKVLMKSDGLPTGARNGCLRLRCTYCCTSSLAGSRRNSRICRCCSSPMYWTKKAISLRRGTAN